MFRRQYGRQIALKEKSPETLVRGCNEGLRQILTVLEEDLGNEGFKKRNVTPLPVPKQ
jgi:hypothetical protein